MRHLSVVPPPKAIVLTVGGFYFGAKPVQVSTLLGSCIAITAWHPKRRIGGLCHYLMPGGDHREAREAGMHAPGAIDLFSQEVGRAGTLPREYVVRIFGGGHMFDSFAADSVPRALGKSRIQELNIAAARRLLPMNGFKIVSDDVGGWGSRNVQFNLATGEVRVIRGPVFSKIQMRGLVV
ncbi:MAG TPA: chemotaxis protein CheD [Steroidobacteraceae bacterium]|jgi:chemotaxis protein CheD